jgi:hypothetical protein
MNPRLHLAMLACIPCATPALGSEPIKPTLDFADFRLVVAYVSTNELMDLQRRHSVLPELRDVRQSSRHGFSILKRDQKTGLVTCEVYLPNAKRPRLVDDDGTLTLGHELLHCMLGDYHR